MSAATAVRLIRSGPRETLAAVEYDDGRSIPVRWQPHRDRPWRCTACGTQERPRCGHTRAVDLTLRAQDALVQTASTDPKETQ